MKQYIEISIHSKLEHPNIIELHGYFRDTKQIYLVLEWAPYGSLYDFLKKYGPLGESETRLYMRQVLDALAYCHQLNVWHRDLKPQNILVGYDHKIKLADFGSSIYNPSDMELTRCGTISYDAPEMRTPKYGKEVDLWSVGVITLELLSGTNPIEEGTDLEQVSAFIPNLLSEQAKDFISKLLMYKPEDRLSAKQAIEHIWIDRID